MSKKYEIVEGMVNVVKGSDGVEHTLHRIRAARSFAVDPQHGGGCVVEGEIGGWVEDYNLSHEGACWVAGNAMVYGGAVVRGDAMVYGGAVVNGWSEVTGRAQVTGHALVTGESTVCDDAVVCDEAVVERGIVRGHGRVSGTGVVYKATVEDEARVYCGRVEKTRIEGHTEVGVGGIVQGMEDRMTVDLPWLYTACGGMVWATCYRTGRGLMWAYDGISSMTGVEVIEEIRLVHGEDAAAKFALVKGAVERCVRARV